MSKRESPVTGYCEDCGMMLDSSYNNCDIDDIVSGYYIGPDGQELCRYCIVNYDDDDEFGDPEGMQ